MPDAPPEVISPARFIKELWGTVPTDWIAEFNLLQYRPTQENPNDLRMGALFYTVGQVIKDWETVARELDKRNRSQVENIHHGVNPRFKRPRKHGLNTDISHYVALWVDVDFKGNEAAVRKQFNEIIEDLRQRGLGPSCIVESGRGLHAYWLLDKPYPVKEARPFCAGIQDYFKISDPVHDPRRILRVPGFLNLKDPKDPRWCSVSEATWQRFPLSAFKDYSIEPTKSEHDRELEEVERNTAKTTSRDPKIEAIKQGVDEGGGPYGGRHLAAVALAGHYCSRRKLTRKAVLYTMHDWNRLNKPPLPDEEIEKVVEDIWTKEQVKRAEEEESGPRRKKGEPEKPSDGPPWFDEDGKFNPALLAIHLMTETRFLSTPVGRDGKGIMLYRYTAGAFRPDGYDFLRREVTRVLGKDARKSRIEETVELVNELTKVSYTEIDRHARDLINVRNGMLRWTTGELLPHDPKYRSLIQVPVDWIPDATSEKLDEFLRIVLPKDALSIAEEFSGLLLVPDTSFAKCLVLVGEGGNGKSTFLKLVEALVGKENISYYSLHSIIEDRFTAAGLLGKLANFHDELEQRALENTGAFKQIVAGDPIKAEEKNKAPFSFRPFCRLMFATNQMPRATDRSQAYFDRLLFLEFRNRIRATTGEILDYGRVLAETPGVLEAFLVRAVAGLRRLMERGRFIPPASSIDAIEEYRRDCNSAYDFLRECCRTDDPNGWLAKNILYERYRAWSEDEGRKPMSAREFARTVQNVPNVRDARHGSARGWGGLSWTNGQPPKAAVDEVAGFGKREEGQGVKQRDLEF
jgi:putative DNA primase/helicase